MFVVTLKYIGEWSLTKGKNDRKFQITSVASRGHLQEVSAKII